MWTIKCECVGQVPLCVISPIGQLHYQSFVSILYHFLYALHPLQDGEVVDFMTGCNPRGPLVIHITKLFPKQDCTRFDAYGRIMSGTIRPGDRVRAEGCKYLCCADV